jgi:uncharacterized protein YbjT (DUF2867 family)
MAPAGVEAVQGDMKDVDSMDAALKGVDTLFLLNAVLPHEATQGGGSAARNAPAATIIPSEAAIGDFLREGPRAGPA